MGSRAVWSAAGGVVIAMSATNAVAWAVGATAQHSPLPLWPAYAFGGIAVVGLYLTLAPLIRLWPFGRLSTPGELLDEAIRRGREARDQIIHEKLDSWAAARVAAEWTLRTSNALHQGFPAIADRFLLASGNDKSFSGQALLIQTINTKMAVLNEARTGLGA